ncbi:MULTISPECIES: hypothetical protein [Polaribacter]|nr:hypothetical protein [Polaribacter butkevichii]
MKNVKRVLVLLLTVLLFNVSCSSDNNDGVDGICEEYSAEFQTTLKKYSDAYKLQYENPSTVNCNNVKKEAQNVINFLEKLKECIPASEKESVNELIADLKETLTESCEEN